ncbi:SDR family NAD(P)-dependent oxidoreductase [Streptomyces sp. NPDC057376]|uniref:SDR family NAD(P)-dependent oxidoreductase n=1 Tax=Streptomyces sp. NPDC057376 TaxID=3346110 RepID=UPI003635EEE7
MSQKRVALVTGGARGQGLAIVRRLRRDGLSVAAADVLDDELRRAVAELNDPEVLPVRLDVTDEQSWATALTEVEQRFDGLNVLVNNAGILGRGMLVDETAEQFERLWRVNCLGMFLGIRAATPLLQKADQPAVVNTLSISALHPFDRHSAYNSSKWAARGLSLTAARELGDLGIRVNAVLPGSVATPMHDAATIERLSKGSLLGRIGESEDIAAMVAVLASPESSFVTGAEVVVDGGAGLRTAH